ncbi:MAG TPA: DUF4133 domain-containing protein [Sediminibacterium sp.]
MSAVYYMNKGLGRPMELLGVCQPFLLWLCAGEVLLLLCFAIGYMTGLSSLLLLEITVPASMGWFALMLRLSRRLGEHGLYRWLAQKQLPRCVSTKHYRTFFLSGK